MSDDIMDLFGPGTLYDLLSRMMGHRHQASIVGEMTGNPNLLGNVDSAERLNRDIARRLGTQEGETE